MQKALIYKMQLLTNGDINYNRGNWKRRIPDSFRRSVTDGPITHPSSTYPHLVISGLLIISV